jgi:hypothetical protein
METRGGEAVSHWLRYGTMLSPGAFSSVLLH